VEEQHRGGAQRAVRTRRLEEVHRGAGQTAQTDLARDELDQRLAPFVQGLVRQVHPRDPFAVARGAPGAPGAVPAIAAAKAAYAAAPRSAKMTCSTDGLRGSSSRTVETAMRAASSSGKPPTPVPRAGKAMLVTPCSRARDIADRTAASIASALLRRSRATENSAMTRR